MKGKIANTYIKLSVIIFCLLSTNIAFAQNEDNCNQLGVWLWHLEGTEFHDHQTLADSLATLGVKRIYVKVADGSVNAEVWPEIEDETLVNTYKEKGMQVWAWSYNYPGSSTSQAQALYQAAKTGYDGYVVDVEMQFDGDEVNLQSLFAAFYVARDRATVDGHINSDFPIYCTTWGNPRDHDFRLHVMDGFVDGYLSQTYVEVWGEPYLNDIPLWIKESNEEYRLQGATKPVHHICATEKGLITADEIDIFIEEAGGETSLWRIPGGGTPLGIWQDWRGVDWHRNFCDLTASEKVRYDFSISPNPVGGPLVITSEDIHFDAVLYITNMQGQLMTKSIIDQKNTQIETYKWPTGVYTISVVTSIGVSSEKIIKY